MHYVVPDVLVVVAVELLEIVEAGELLVAVIMHAALVVLSVFEIPPVLDEELVFHERQQTQLQIATSDGFDHFLPLTVLVTL